MKTPAAKPGPQRRRQPGSGARTKKATADTANAATTAEAGPAAAASTRPAAPMAQVPMHVRWGDLDAFNHVNNATFLVYAQEARLAWLAGVEGTWFDETMMPVVAAAHMNYRRQLAWPAAIVVELAATRVGTSSVTIAHRVLAAGDDACLYADGEVVMVWVDPERGTPVPLPDAIRRAVAPHP
jgi:acyl-CoA thioester hydrolase